MTDPLARIRAAALLLPDTEEREADGAQAFFVGGMQFAACRGDRLTTVAPEGEQTIELGGDADWALIEDRIARAWELVAPDALLEAGGR